MSFLGDSDVGGSKTLATMEATVTAFGPASTHAENLNMRARINQGLDLGANTGDYTTTTIQAASTVAGLAQTTATDPRKTAGAVPE